MNKEDRKELNKLIESTTALAEKVRGMSESEQEKFDNLGDSLQQAETGVDIENAASQLENAADDLDNAQSLLESI